MKDLAIMVAISVFLMSIGAAVGFLGGIAVAYKATERARSAAYAQGAMDCEQFHKAQEQRDQLRGVALHPEAHK